MYFDWVLYSSFWFCFTSTLRKMEVLFFIWKWAQSKQHFKVLKWNFLAFVSPKANTKNFIKEPTFWAEKNCIFHIFSVKLSGTLNWFLSLHKTREWHRGGVKRKSFFNDNWIETFTQLFSFKRFLSVLHFCKLLIEKDQSKMKS